MFLVRYFMGVGEHSIANLVTITGIILINKALTLQLNASLELIQAMTSDISLAASKREPGDASNRTSPSVYFSQFVMLVMAFVASPVEMARSAAIAFLFSYLIRHGAPCFYCFADAVATTTIP
jgi:hypothetical protein